MRKYFENDDEMVIPKRYSKWSKNKLNRVLKRKEFWNKVRNRKEPSENKLERINYKVFL